MTGVSKMIGIFVNEDGGIHYAAALVRGYKIIETRTRNMLAGCVGKRVAIIRTRRGKHPVIIGYVDIIHAAKMSGQWLADNRCYTLIPEGSKYDCNGAAKWCYWVSNPETCEPYELPADAVRHGRSWCEF